MDKNQAAAAIAAALDVARDMARTYEPDRYLAALLAPRSARPALIILAAFAGELTRITQLHGEPLLREMRLQWWRDALGTNATDARSGNPMAEALRTLRASCEQTEALTDAALDTAATQIYAEPPASLSDLAADLAASQGTHFQLAAVTVAGKKEPSPSSETAEAAGIAYGLARLVYGLPQSLARGENPLPQDLTREQPVTSSMATDTRPPSNQLHQIVQRLRDEALIQLRGLQNQLACMSRAERAAYLPLAMVGPYLQNSKRHDESDYTTHIPLLPHSRPWHIWRLHRTGQVPGQGLEAG